MSNSTLRLLSAAGILAAAQIIGACSSNGSDDETDPSSSSVDPSSSSVVLQPSSSSVYVSSSSNETDPSSSSVAAESSSSETTEPSSSSEAGISSSSEGKTCPANDQMTRADADECVTDALEKCVIEKLIDGDKSIGHAAQSANCPIEPDRDRRKVIEIIGKYPLIFDIDVENGYIGKCEIEGIIDIPGYVGTVFSSFKAQCK